MPKKILIIGLVWPEPKSSAAGWRILQLIDFFQEQNYTVYFASAASKSEHSYPLMQKRVTEKSIQLNDSSFDDYITEIQPDMVMFDRFVTEEQFGWRVRNILPDSLTILDTEDLHFVRKAREIAYKKNLPVNFFSSEAKREIASILRCDLTLIISQFEMNLLINDFHIQKESLMYIPFIQQQDIDQNEIKFSDRQHFMFIGNCLHEPNYQTILKLKKDIWAKIKKQLPETELHIYGAYMTEKVLQLHNPETGFIIKGRAENVLETMKNYRVLLAPIPFGAGIKGKFVDAMRAGLPSVTTSVGAEDMKIGSQWCGFIVDQDDLFVTSAIDLHHNQQVWEKAKNTGFALYKKRYQNIDYLQSLSNRINEISANLNRHRQQNFIGQILHDNQYNALKYMSKWIEEKNKRI